jgi:hydrogenase expression/formation protein HypC
MCLGDLGQVLRVETGAGGAATAVVDTGVRTVAVSLLTINEPVAPGDWLVCHSGFALARVTAEEAREAAALRSAPPLENTIETEARP